MVVERGAYFDPRELDTRLTGELRFCAPDIKDPKTLATFVFSPQTCIELYEEAVQGAESRVHDRRRVISFVPLFHLANEAGWDAVSLVEAGCMLPRISKQEPFSSWGVTEKLDLSKFIRLAHEKLPAFLLAAMIGLIEELVIVPTDVLAWVPKRDIKPPVGLKDLNLVTLRDFGIEVFPLGVIFNQNRRDSPVALVTPATIVSNRLPKSRSSKDEIAYWIETDVKSDGAIGLAMQQLSDRFALQFPLDTWGSLVAQCFEKHPVLTSEARQELGITIGREDFLRLEDRILTQ